MNGAFKFLILADESAEFAAAALYAALRAKVTGAGLVMLRVIAPTQAAYWSVVEDEMRREAQDAARALTDRFAAELWAETGVAAEVVIREGEMRAELRALIEADRAIKALVLGAGSGREGPGPLVGAIAKGGGIGGRPLPVIVVPGLLTKDEVRALAAPAAPAAPAAGD